MIRSGLDWAWHAPGRPRPTVMRAAGYDFAVRYVWAKGNPPESKRLTLAEATALSAAGIDLVCVYQSSASFMLDGRAGGVTDASVAHRNATAAGMPASRPIYFAADFDVSSSQQDTINVYLEGARSVLGAGRVGLYGGYNTITRAVAYWRSRHAGERLWTWQTRAWSGGRWATVDIRQGATLDVDGVDCDINTAHSSYFGQWRVGQIPEEDDMTPAQFLELLDDPGVKSKLQAMTWGYQDKGQPSAHGIVLGEMRGSLRTLVAQEAGQAAAVGKLAEAVEKLGAGQGLPPDFVGQVRDAARVGAEEALKEAVRVDVTVGGSEELTEEQKVAWFHQLVADGLSDHEARAQVWGDEG